MFTEEYSATVTMETLPRSTNKMVFAPATGLTQVLSHSVNHFTNLGLHIVVPLS